MQLERLAIALRPREPFEAIDLGMQMALRWAWPLLRIWLLLVLPLLAVLQAALPQQPFAAALILWWLLPLIDRFLLQVLAAAVFGRVPPVAETLGSLRAAGRGVGWTLLLRPFAWQRSFTAPLRQLEGQHGAAYRARRALLMQRVGGHVGVLALACVGFVLVALAGFAGLAALLVPGDAVDTGAADSALEPEWWSWSLTWQFALALTLVEPLHVAAGFALYLNRRVQLEGWDLELGLRRIVSERGGVPLLVAIALLACPAPMPVFAADGVPTERVRAQPLEPAAPRVRTQPTAVQKADKLAPAQRASYTPHDTAARRAIVDILSQPEYGYVQEVRRWRAKARDAAPDNPEPPPLAGIGATLAAALRALGWVAALALAMFLLWTIATRWQPRTPTAPAAAADVLFGLAIGPDSLPPDLAAAARAALARGAPREALSLLYRGLLSSLVHRRGLAIGDGATEGDVQRLAAAMLDGAAARYVERLLPAWIALAYGHRLPDSGLLQALIDEYDAGIGGALPAMPMGAAPPHGPAFESTGRR